MENKSVIDTIHPHTIKKIELIEAYVEAWAYKLLEYGRQTQNCKGIVFIDCMCNSGIYYDEQGSLQEGTPIRIAKKIMSIMCSTNYQCQQAYLYFNDISKERIEILKQNLPKNRKNMHIMTSVGDGNELLKSLGKNLSKSKMCYLVLYDPYTASIDWEAIMPFLKCWGEVIINHMVSDSIRAVGQAKRPEMISKYENTYLTNIEELLSYRGDRNAYSKRVEKIITSLRGYTTHRYYIASFPFFNSKNALVYDLIHCTNNLEGFKLYKKTAWKTFGNKSSTKRTKIASGQMSLEEYMDEIQLPNDICYRVEDIVDYIKKKFKGKNDVQLKEIWALLDEHPIFPSDPYKKEIKKRLKDEGCKIHKSSIDFGVKD